MNQENNTFFVGKVLHHYETLTSTNQYAQQLIAHQAAEGTVVRADFQTAGRGQLGKSWESQAAQNVTLSIVFYPKFLLARQQFLFNQAISLGVRDATATFLDVPVTVKWSNDIYVFQKKIAGILLQNTLSGANLQSSIVGIGLNINQKKFSPDIPNPTSLALAQQKTFSLNEVQEELFRCIEKWYLLLRAGKYDLIRQTYLQHLYLFQQKTGFQRPDGTCFEGKIVGIDPIGKLLVLHNNRTEAFSFKEIIFLHT